MGPMTVDGNVVDVQSHWTADGGRIATDATTQTPDGPVVVTQLGGHADGLGQRVFDGEPLIELGMRVTVIAHPDYDLSSRLHNVVDSVKVTADPAGFVRTGPTKAGNYLYWESGCVFLTVDSDGTKEVAGDGEFPVIDQCIATWNDGAASCSYLQVMDAGKKSGEVNGKDYTNVLKFRDTSWCRPATADAPAKCYSESSAGITTATYVDDGGKRDGAIVDADSEGPASLRPRQRRWQRPRHRRRAARPARPDRTRRPARTNQNSTQALAQVGGAGGGARPGPPAGARAGRAAAGAR